MRIEAQGKYLQSILEKAREALAGHTLDSPSCGTAQFLNLLTRGQVLMPSTNSQVGRMSMLMHAMVDTNLAFCFYRSKPFRRGQIQEETRNTTSQARNTTRASTASRRPTLIDYRVVDPVVYIYTSRNSQANRWSAWSRAISRRPTHVTWSTF